MLRLVLMTMVVAGAAWGQVRTIDVTKISLPAGEEWSAPKFSPDGARLYLTRLGYGGIWEYDLRSGVVRAITRDAGSGYGFSVSQDGSRIAYRRTSVDPSTMRRLQELVVRDLSTGGSTVVASGNDVSTPSFVASMLVYRAGERSVDAPPAPGRKVEVLGIENTKIAILRDGERRVIDPLGGGSYIWPSVSPDGNRILACDMTRGAFVCTPGGAVVAMLGKRNAPVWSRDGRWVIYMDDTDDGHRVTASDIMAVSADGATTVRLTGTADIIELYPECSPTENLIACSSLSGDIYIIRYEEAGR